MEPQNDKDELLAQSERFINKLARRFEGSGTDHHDLVSAGTQAAFEFLEERPPVTESWMSFARAYIKHIKQAIQLKAVEDFIHRKAWDFKGSSVPHEDLFQAGVLGALDALESYDQEKGVKFLTYAHDFIVAAIREEANQRVVSTPAWFRSQIMGPVLRTLDRITAEKGSEPTVGEVTEDEELRTELVQNVTALQNTNDEAVTEQIELALQQAYLHGWLSLEDSLVEPADEDESTEDKVAQMLAYEQMELALNQVLTDRELLALTMRYGLNGQDESTLKEIATELGVSIPHTHRIVMAALDKIARDPKLRRVTRGLGYD